MAAASTYLVKASSLLTKRLKDVIREKGLVDTGKLLSSVSTKSMVEDMEVSFEITAEDYFESLDDRYGLVREILDSSDGTTIIELLEDYVAAKIEEQIDEEINK